eukprot:889569-Pleurochrysis_carterae.AAC.1
MRVLGARACACSPACVRVAAVCVCAGEASGGTVSSKSCMQACRIRKLLKRLCQRAAHTSSRRRRYGKYFFTCALMKRRGEPQRQTRASSRPHER